MIITITDEKLAIINAGRAARGLPPLTKQEAIKLARDRRAEAVAQGNHSDQSSDFLMHFLIGYSTGIPFPSVGGFIGAAMHETSKPTTVSIDFASDLTSWKPDPTAGSYDFGEAPTASSSSDSSSPSSDSGSSSSSDSGSSSGGGGE